MINFRKIITENRGQTIIEATIALGLIIVVLGAISGVVITSLSNSQFSQNQALAARYAQEGVEYIKYLSNNNPNTFASKASASGNLYCFNSLDEADPLDPVECNNLSNIGGQFMRTAQFEPDDEENCGGGTRVTVWVEWNSGKCADADRFCHESRLDSCFPNEPAAPNL